MGACAVGCGSERKKLEQIIDVYFAKKKNGRIHPQTEDECVCVNIYLDAEGKDDAVVCIDSGVHNVNVF